MVRGRGNVFADLGVAGPELALAKAKLAQGISRIVAARGWTPVGAAAVMGFGQPKASALLLSRIEGFSTDRLIRLLGRLGRDVAIALALAPAA